MLRDCLGGYLSCCVLNTNLILGGVGDRYEARKRPDHEMFDRGQFASQTTNTEAYVGTKGERYDKRVPQDNIQRSDGTFDSMTVNREMYQGGKGETLGRIINLYF